MLLRFIRIGMIPVIAIVAITLWLSVIKAQANLASGGYDIDITKTQSDSVWENLGLYGARIDDRHGGIVFDTADNTVYMCATSAIYGIYRSDDGAQSWHPVTNTVAGCKTLAFDANQGYLYWAHQYDSFLSRSDDGGLTWQNIFTASSVVSAITIDPINSTTVFIGLGRKQSGDLYKTTDSGSTWQSSQFSHDGIVWFNQLDTGITAISVDPTNPGIVFASAGRYVQGKNDRGIYRSTDGGQNFIRVITDTLGEDTGVNINANGTVFARANEQILRSRTQENTWDDVTPQADYGGWAVAFHPEIPEHVWMWNYYSDDEGDSWVQTGILPPYVHPVITTTLYGPTFFGIQKSIDSGQTWQDVNIGLEEVNVTRIGVDPNNSQRYFIITMGAIGYTENDGQTWEYPVLVEDFLDILIDPSNPDIVYTTFWGCTIYKSEDGGQTWDQYDYNFDFDCSDMNPNRMVLDSSDTLTGFLAIDTGGPPGGIWGGVFKTTNGGVNWITTTLYDIPIKTLLLVSDTNSLYAGALNQWDDTTVGGVYLSQDSGLTWERSGLNGIPVNDLEVDPHHPLHLYAGTNIGIYTSNDGGISWQAWENVVSYPQVTDIAIDPQNTNYVYAIVDVDIYRSTNAGVTWELLYPYSYGDGIPRILHLSSMSTETTKSLVSSLSNLSNPSVLYKGSARGLYRTTPPNVFIVNLPIIFR